MAEMLGADLSDPDCFAQAEAALADPAVAIACFGPSFDSHGARRTLAALAQAADERGVPPSQLWNALDALERN